MTQFIPRTKLSKKARKELDAKKRTTWAFSPVTKKVESKKIYNRKKAAHVWKDDSSMSGFCCTGDGAAANAICMCAFNLRRALLAVRSDAQKDYFDEESWKTFAEREQRQAVLEMQQKYSHRLLTAQWNRDRMQSLVKTNLFPVVMTERFHLFPSRTQKLSSPVLKVLGWTRPGRISHCRIP